MGHKLLEILMKTKMTLNFCGLTMAYFIVDNITVSFVTEHKCFLFVNVFGKHNMIAMNSLVSFKYYISNCDRREKNQV